MIVAQAGGHDMEHSRTSAPHARASVERALDVVRWSGRFYWRHIWMVAGISLVPSAQRAVSQLWGAHLPGWSGMAGEAVTAIARVVLFVLVLRLAILNDDRLRDLPGEEAWQRITAFVRDAWRSLVVQVLLFAALFAVVDLLPDFVIAPRVPAGAQPVYWAALLAIKNPTVIAFAIIWQIGAVRQALLLGPRDRSSPRAEHDLAQRTGAAEES